MSLSPVMSLSERLEKLMRGRTLKDLLGRGPAGTPPFLPQGTGDLLRRNPAVQTSAPGGRSLLDELDLGDEEAQPAPLASPAGGGLGRMGRPSGVALAPPPDESDPGILRAGEPMEARPSLLRAGERAGRPSIEDEITEHMGAQVQRPRRELDQMNQRPGWKQGLGGLAALAAPLIIAALGGGEEGLEGAAQGVSEVQDRGTAQRDLRRKTLESELSQAEGDQSDWAEKRVDIGQRDRAAAAAAARQAPIDALNQQKTQLEVDALKHPRLSLEQAYSQAVQDGDLEKAKSIREQMGAAEAAKRAPEKPPALSDTEQRVQDYLASKGLPNTPKNRDDASVAIANRNTAQPSEEDAKGAAQDILAHRLAPSQMSSIYGGFGTAAQKFKRMVIAEARKIDPEFDYEQAESEYQLAKSPGFQNTVRYMTSVQDSIPLVIDRAKKLNNGKVRSITALLNAGKGQVNDVDLKKFQTDRLLVADEIAKILQGGGTGSGTSDAKLSQAGKILSETDSPAAIAGALADVNELLGYRRKALVRGTYMDRNNSSGSAPAAAESEVFGQDGKTLIGHVVAGKFVSLEKVPAASRRAGR